MADRLLHPIRRSKSNSAGSAARRSYESIAAGDIEVVKIGSRTLATHESLERVREKPQREDRPRGGGLSPTKPRARRTPAPTADVAARRPGDTPP